jgi:hypothetical protein
MSKSLKETKLLLEGWRKFYLKEAEEPATEGGGKVVRIFDFDGTLVTPRVPTKYSYLLSNLFYVPFLNSDKYDEVVNDLKEAVKKPENHNKEIEKLMNPSTDYIITAMSSIGLDKRITSYLLYQLSKQEGLFLGFARRVAGIQIESAYKKPEMLAPDADQEDMPEEEPEQLSPDAITQQEIQELRKVIESDPEIKDVKDSYRINTDSRIVRKIITKLGKGFDIGKRVSMKDLTNLKKEIVSAAYPNLPADQIKVSLNIAMLPEDPELSGIVKGSSGKFKPAKEVAIENPEAKFEVYDNKVNSMSQVRMGLYGKTKDQAEQEEAAESSENIDENTPIATLENKISLVNKGLSIGQNVDFKYIKGNQIVDYNNGPFSLGKKDPSEKPGLVGFGGGYRSLRRLASVYIKKEFLTLEGTSGKGRTSEKVIQLFKKFKDYCDNNGYKDLMDCITFSGKDNQGVPYATLYKFFEPQTLDVQPTFELNKIVAQQLVKLYENKEDIKNKLGASEIVPAEATPEQTKLAAKTATEEPKTKKDSRQSVISGEEGADEGEIGTAAFEDDDLSWNEMSDSAKKKYRIEYRKKKQALRETVLKELKPMLAKLATVSKRIGKR